MTDLEKKIHKRFIKWTTAIYIPKKVLLEYAQQVQMIKQLKNTAENTNYLNINK